MTHEDRGNYAGKHPQREIDPVVVEKLEKLKDKNQITCAAAHRVASDLNISPKEVGVQVDLMELRLVQCQLGLFGHTPGSGQSDKEIRVPDDLKLRLEKATKEGRISCKACWDIAKEFKMSRMDIGSVCKKIDLRIKPCQLGTF